MKILPGDCIFVWGESLIDEAIEFVTHGPNHVAIFVDNGETIAEAQGGRKSGETPLSYYLESDNRLEVWRDESLTDEEREKIVEYAKSQYGNEYDYIGILVELVRFELGISIKDYHEGKRRICSSFVENCAESVGRKWSNIPYVPAPVDLIESKKLTFIEKLK